MIPSSPCCSAAASSASPSSKLSEKRTVLFRLSRSFSSRLRRSSSGRSTTRLALDLEQVEDVVDDRRPALALLHRREARAAFLVEGADLAVDDAVRRLQRLRRAPWRRLEARGVVLVLAGPQLGLAAGDRADDAVAVPLDLVEPVSPLRHLIRERGEHRPVARAACGLARPSLPSCGRSASSSRRRRGAPARARRCPSAACRRGGR